MWTFYNDLWYSLDNDDDDDFSFRQFFLLILVCLFVCLSLKKKLPEEEDILYVFLFSPWQHLWKKRKEKTYYINVERESAGDIYHSFILFFKDFKSFPVNYPRVNYIQVWKILFEFFWLQINKKKTRTNLKFRSKKQSSRWWFQCQEKDF